jgi:predicted O-linked N-acetylglucosamine transferase (SPINDLY family)
VPSTWAVLGEALQETGKAAGAVTAYRNAVRPRYLAGIYNNLGNSLTQVGQFEQALAAYAAAVEHHEDAGFYINRAKTLRRLGKRAEAGDALARALQLDPASDAARIGFCMTQLPHVYESEEEIDERRRAYARELDRVVAFYAEAPVETRARAARAVGDLQPFLLGYQGRNDRDLQKIYGTLVTDLLAARFPEWSRPVPMPPHEPDGRIRVGFVTAFFRRHSVWKIPLRGWLEHLDRSRFRLYAYCTEQARDDQTRRAEALVDRFVQGKLATERWCEIISKDRIHVLIYPELGMDPSSAALAALRLAPVQMSGVGHPITSGLSTIDYYISSKMMEPTDAQAHYTEKLLPLPNLGFCAYGYDEQTEARNKTELDLDSQEVLFFCCQSLYKYLPQHDDVFAAIASRAPQSVFVFIEYHAGVDITRKFSARLERQFEQRGLDARRHTRFLSRLSPSDFSRTAAAADVFLDSIGWSGCNSALETLWWNVPIVTWPGALMRGRHALAFLQRLGLTETVATSKENYIDIAARLACDDGYRESLRAQISQRKFVLFDDESPVDALSDVLQDVVTTGQPARTVKN